MGAAENLPANNSLLSKVLMIFKAHTLLSRDGSPVDGSKQDQAFHFGGMSPSHAWDIYMPLAGNTGVTPGRHLLHSRTFKWGKYIHPELKLVLDTACGVEYTALVGIILLKCWY